MHEYIPMYVYVACCTLSKIFPFRTISCSLLKFLAKQNSKIFMLIFVFNYVNTYKYTFLFIFLWNGNEFTDQTNICITYLFCSHRAHAQCMLAMHVHMCVSV